MDAMKHLNDFKPIDSIDTHLQLDSIPSNSQSERVVESIQSYHLQLDSIPSNSQSKEVVESIDSSSFEALSLVKVGFDNLLMDSTPSKAQLVVGDSLLNGDVQVVDNHASNSGLCSHDPQVAFVENAQVVDNHSSNSGQCNYDLQVAYVENAQAVDNHISNARQYSYDPQVAYAENYISNARQYSYDPQVAYAENYISNAGQYSFYPEVAYAENAQVVDNHTSNSGQCSYDPQVAYVENAQAVDNYISNSGQCSYDPQGAYVFPSSSASNNSFTYNGITYYSYKAFEQDLGRQFIQNCLEEMQMDGVAPRYDDVDEPRFSDCMVFATGGSPAVINPYNGLPWRKGANLCRPYIEEGCCHFGTACIFHHPWPPTKDLP